MASWRCPHCGAPQPESARCWVCRRSTTSCASCRHFRIAVTARIGYCGLDSHRAPLTGDEERACWEGSPGEWYGDPSVGRDEVDPATAHGLWGPAEGASSEDERGSRRPIPDPPVKRSVDSG